MRSVPRRPREWRLRLIRRATKTRDPIVLNRARVIYSVTAGRSAAETAEILGCARAHVYRTVARWLEGGWHGLLDRRIENGWRKACGRFHEVVRALLDRSPRDFGYMRPTWTRELLILVAHQETGVEVSVCVMGRVLRKIGARRGRPKPIVACRLSERQRRRRLSAIRNLIANLPANEVAVYEDEVDIHLNPKIGLDWMNRGVQKEVLTPGQNEKAYLAGTLDSCDGTILWVGGTEKNSGLFIAMLRRLDEHYSHAQRIHVILDNYGIHDSYETQAALEDLPRIRLHFLPPYCPDENRIERLWLDLHANVTRNHKHTSLLTLCPEVIQYLKHKSPWRAGEACPPAALAA